ncbi:hypothetical protein GFV14_00692 [Candidatus Hartigia pinicola]|nr:hypothetical protein GFV14_00692 [Candidatus Hartigia pinicola]
MIVVIPSTTPTMKSFYKIILFIHITMPGQQK